MSTLSLEWLKQLLDRCLQWKLCVPAVVGFDDLQLADELMDFSEGLQPARP
jgi:hypothetical protein